ncbi:Holliday junction resolvase RuvX [SAR202 cluster bacterium AD-804-J14_MRT_500m]|nr:Holliday junction resolvase RuvX [SAR202 cluster bacterium AD-804-J14_MRT_500m]
MRTLGLDVGNRRIGISISDGIGIIASPLGYITRTVQSEDVFAILREAAHHGVGHIIIGIPFLANGSIGEQARLVNKFRCELQAQTDLLISTWDERYSTIEAERLLREVGRKPSREKGKVDAAAAAVILQSYLDQQRS